MDNNTQIQTELTALQTIYGEAWLDEVNSILFKLPQEQVAELAALNDLTQTQFPQVNFSLEGLEKIVIDNQSKLGDSKQFNLSDLSLQTPEWAKNLKTEKVFTMPNRQVQKEYSNLAPTWKAEMKEVGAKVIEKELNGNQSRHLHGLPFFSEKLKGGARLVFEKITKKPDGSHRIKPFKFFSNHTDYDKWLASQNSNKKK